MENQGSENNMEEFFKKSLRESEESPYEEAWNTPSDEVWAHIKENVRVKEKGKKGLLLVLLLSASLILSLGFIFFQNYKQSNQLEQLSEKVEEYESVLDSIYQELQTINQAPADPSTLAKKKESKALLDAKTPLTSQKLQTLSSANAGLKNPTVFFNKKILLDNTLIADIDQINVPTTTIQSLNKEILPIDLLTNTLTSEIKSQPIFPIKTVEKDPKKRSTYLIAQVGPALARAELPTHWSTIHKSRSSYSGAILYGWKLNHNWSIETGLQFRKINTQSTKNKKIRYQLSEESLNTAGLYESSYDYDLPGEAVEAHSEIVVLREQESEIPPETDFDIQTVSTNQRYYLEVPITAQYGIHFGRFNVGARAGLLTKFLIGNKTHVDMINLENPDFTDLEISHRKSDSRHNPANVRLHYLLGLAMEYQLTKQLGVTIHPMYDKRIFTYDSQGRSHKRANNLNTSIGLKFNF